MDLFNYTCGELISGMTDMVIPESGSVVELKNLRDEFVSLAWEYWDRIKEGAEYDDNIEMMIEARFDAFEAAIAAEESANDEALYWESLELAI